MADERYQWLDPEAAERLLRGEPVDPSARTAAAALAAALEAARASAAPAPGTPLAGEEAALAAFRAATAARAASAPGTTAPADLGKVRLVRAASAAGRPWGRSLRYGLAAALAAVTVGGVAVAAGTGVLPLVDKEPSRTVTAAETATPPDPREPTSGIERHPEPLRSPGPGTPAPGASPTGGPDGTTTAPRPRATPSAGDRTGARGTTPSARARPSGGEARLTACREYRTGRLDAAGRQRLSGALRAGETLRAYCDELLATGAEGNDSAGSGNGAGDDRKGDGTKDGSQDDSKDDGSKDDDPRGDDRGRDRDDGRGGDGSRDGAGPAGDGRERSDALNSSVPAPADSRRGPGRGAPGPKDRPRAKAGTRTGTTPLAGTARTAVAALALCPTGAPAPGV
ncbi:hypothetical protein [Streptomyces omiyaensis]|uniref:hypothetical protein n=1 Tax=Streptomyces omiyaensis TaxID=68247 RepID=UPI0037006155